MQEPSLTGDTGVKMTGPYEYVVPEFWMEEKDRIGDRGGAFGFNTETGPGPAIPTIETLTQILPKKHLWPIDDWWNFHAGLHDFKDIHVFQRCLNIRYGEATSLEDFATRSQVMRYEAIRAMYEAFSRNKYDSTGVIAWMLNNSWPSMIWNLYDYELRTGGGYFGTKNAIQPLHPLYGYDDHAVWVVSSQYKDATNLRVTATIYDFKMKKRFSQQEILNVAADSTNKVFTLPVIPDLTPVYFLKLTLADATGKLVGSNFYWLTSKPETITQGVVNLEDGFAQTFADFRPLSQLPKTTVKATTHTAQENGDVITEIALQNNDATLAFFIRLNLSTCGSGKEILPVLWSDNYISLLPGETQVLTATFRAPHPDPVRVDIAGWNVNRIAVGCAGGSQ
jgi:exo-1,4-beta-D-glucosaminidase